MFNNYKIDYKKEINVWIERWSKVKADEKLNIQKELLSKFAIDSSMMPSVENLLAQNLTDNDRSLELLNKNLQLSIKTIILTRLLKSNLNYKKINKDKEISILIDVLKKL